MGSFDIQVNGYGGVDYNQDDLSAEELHRSCEMLRADGVDGILATIITEAPEKMVARLQRLVALREADPFVREVIAGLHVEGPFLSPVDGFRGAHPLDAIRKADERLAGQLLEAGSGLVRIFTLAPEQDPEGRVTRLLKKNGVVISAGHTDASLDELRAGIDAGVSMITHLGNGCPMMMNRHDNIIQRALFLREHLWLGFIADGVHILYPALRNYLDLAGERALITTDAMAAAGLGSGLHRISRWEVLVKEDLAAWAPDGSHLLGSAMSMPNVMRNLTEKLALSDERIQRLISEAPRQSIEIV
ncbi:MAG: N-acetylglucosamine-6-phosphate deacetylase [Verrucomicrobiales bacterium]|jgi:N-acetylglucosamine-6-phosphate deacetylase